MDSLSDDEADALRSVLLSNTSHKELAATLRFHGFDVSETSVRRWRSKNA